MADLKITELAALAGADLAAGDLLAIADISASETKKITVTDFLGNAVTLIADATIPGAKILFGSASIPGSALANGAVAATQLATGAVTATKLADESTVDLVTALPVSGAFIGQIALDTGSSKAYIWDGSNWIHFKAAGSVNTVIGSTAGIVNLSVATSGDQVTITTSLDDTTSAAQFLAGPSGAAGAVSYRTITGDDLPDPTTTTKGGVSINGEGLRINAGRIEIDNDLASSGGTFSVVEYSDKGLVTDGRALIASDLPIATSSAVGAVTPGSGLDVDGNGALNHVNAATPGTYTKVTIDSEGHVTAGDVIAAADLPSHSAALLTSGTLEAGRIASSTVTGDKLADYATASIANSAPVADYIGQLFFNPLDRTLFMWDGNVYQPIGVSYGQVIFAGTYDASTNLVSSVTVEGAAIGLAVGAALPSAVAANKAHYVVVDEAGTGTAPAPTVSLSPPDILLSTGSDWTLLDVSDTVVAQLASNVQVTPAGDIASTNVQAALQELDTEKLPKAGGTMTGNLELGAAVDIVFEGANANANETTLTVVDPTADRTITLPDVTGTVITTGDTGTVTSTMITNGTIVNADINASAAIADTKLATIATAGKVSNSATTAASANTASAIVARDASGNFSAGTVTASLTGAASLNVLKAGDTMTGPLSVPLGSASAPSIYPGTDTNTGLYSPGADQVAISTNGTGRLFVDSTGRVGVGASSLTYKLTSDAGSINTPFLAKSAATDNLCFINFAAANTTNEFSVRAGATGDNFLVRTLNSERLRIASDGKLGLGTSTPDALLTVNGVGAHGLGSVTAPSFAFTGDLNTGFWSPAADTIAASTGGSERFRCDSSGRLLVGTSSALSVADEINGTATSDYGIQRAGSVYSSSMALLNFANSVTNARAVSIVLGRSNGSGTAHTLVEDGDELGAVSFQGSDGTKFVRAANIKAVVDGVAAADDMPGRLVFSVTADGSALPTEAFRITNDRVRAYNQAAPAAVNATATLTVANLKTGIITSTSAAATDMTLPTGTDTEGGFSGIYTNMTFEWSVINTGPSLVTLLANTAHTLVGSGAVATGTSARFASRRSAANTFVTYRLT